MSREVYVHRNGKVVLKRQAASRHASSPAVHTDGMDALWHPATGKYADSKSEFRRMTKESGCVEVGNDVRAPAPRAPHKMDRQERVDSIKQAIHQLR